MVRSRPSGGGDNWSYKTCKSPVLLLNQQCQSTEGKCIAVLHLLNGQFPQQPGKADTKRCQTIYCSKRWWRWQCWQPKLWCMCRSFVPNCSEITITTSIPILGLFTGCMPFLPRIQQCPNTETMLCVCVCQYVRWQRHRCSAVGKVTAGSGLSLACHPAR